MRMSTRQPKKHRPFVRGISCLQTSLWQAEIHQIHVALSALQEHPFRRQGKCGGFQPFLEQCFLSNEERRKKGFGRCQGGHSRSMEPEIWKASQELEATGEKPP